MDDLLKRLDQMIDIKSNLVDTKKEFYEFNGLPVPRVTNILQDTTPSRSYINIAANMGKFWFIHTNRALNVGTLAHKWIEEFLKGQPKSENYTQSNEVIQAANTAFDNFTRWHRLFSRHYGKPTVIAIEERLSCPYYGGTADCIMNMHGNNVLVDFKTSKSIDYTYIMQLCAYKYIIDNYRKDLPHIDAIGVIRVSKENINSYEDLFLNESIPDQKAIIDKNTEAFMIATQQWYSIHTIKDIIEQYESEYDIKKVFTVKE